MTIDDSTAERATDRDDLISYARSADIGSDQLVIDLIDAISSLRDQLEKREAVHSNDIEDWTHLAAGYQHQIAEEQATLEAALIVTDDMRSVGWHIGKTVSELGDKLYAILSAPSSTGGHATVLSEEWGVEFPGGVCQVSDDRGDVEDWVQWIVDGTLVSRTVTKSEWSEVTEGGNDHE